MIREIGSEFWDIPCKGDNAIFPDETEWFISGRSALQAILNENNFKTAAVPVWCCESMIAPFINRDIDVVFYLDNLPQTDVALVLDYFGYSNYGVDTSTFKGAVIRDLTHSIFSKEYNDADYYFGSLRKWAGFVTGGFAWGFKKTINFEKENNNYINFRKQAMRLKEDYILGKSNNKEYLSLFADAEELLDDIKIIPAFSEDIELAHTLNVSFIKEQRRKNAKVLMNAFKDMLVFPFISDEDCPLFVPIRVKNRDKLRKYLIDHQVYCPIHWPVSEYHQLDDKTKKLQSEELSLVCDQRYSEQDMNYIVKLIKEYMEKERA